MEVRGAGQTRTHGSRRASGRVSPGGGLGPTGTAMSEAQGRGAGAA